MYRLQSSKEQRHTKQQTSKASLSNTSHNKCTSAKSANNAHQHQSSHQQPPPSSYNLGNYFPRVASEPTSRKSYQTSPRDRDLKVGGENRTKTTFVYFI